MQHTVIDVPEAGPGVVCTGCDHADESMKCAISVILVLGFIYLENEEDWDEAL